MSMIEKVNEMIKQGINPYNNDVKIFNSNNIMNNQNIMRNKQIIIKDNDESDKYLNDFLQNRNEQNLSTQRNRSKKEIYEINLEDDNTKKLVNNYRTENNLNSVVSDNKTNQNTQPIFSGKKDPEKLTGKELEHYKRVQRIMNAGPKIGIFGVNNYNPENSIYSIKNPLSANKKENNNKVDSNKINKTIRIGSRQNHNFVSVINKTRMVPIKKKNTKDKSKITKNKEEDDGMIRVINLEQNFLSQLKDNEKNDIENENKTGNESTSNITKSNKNNSNENIENEDNHKSNSNENDNNNNQNEVQGYFLNIINSKQPNKENENIENKSKNSDNNKKEINNENFENNEYSNSNKKKSLNSKNFELNINDIKNIKLIMTKKYPFKNLIPKNDTRKAKLNNADIFSSKNNTLVRHKTNNSLSKNNHRHLSNNNLYEISNDNIVTESMPKRSHSISGNIQKKEENNNTQNNSKITISNNNIPNITSNKINVPLSSN